MKTFGQQIKWDFETNGELEIFDKNGYLIYFEDSDGYWARGEFDSKGNQTYFETSEGYWYKREYNSEGNCIYFEDSKGKIADYRPETVKNTLN